MIRNEPTNAQDVEEIINQRVATALAEPGVHLTLDVAWRGATKTLPVVTVPQQYLRYNPETHRIRAQRTFDGVKDALLAADPWGKSAQDYLHYLLGALPIDPSRKDPAYTKLSDDLKERGQRDPGIITPSGILINGNTRCAALRDLGVHDIKVAVLPSDWNWDDLALVELDLQMTMQLKRDYSFINLLLAMEESVNITGIDDTCKAFRVKDTTIQRNLWILEFLRDLVERSTVGEDRLDLRDFEEDQGKLEELYRTYNAAYKADAAAAERLLVNRTVALLLGKSKTDLRLVDQSFSDDYLSKQLKDNPPVNTGDEQETITIPGFGDIVEVPDSSDSDAAKLVDELAKARARARSTSEADVESGKATLKKIDDAMEKALKSASSDGRLKNTKAAVSDKVRTASDALDEAANQVAVAKSKGALDEEALSDALVVLNETLNRLADTVLSVATTSGDGIEFLKSIRLAGQD